MAMLIPIRDHNPYRRFPIVTVALIAVNVYVFFKVGISQEAAFRYGAVPCDVVGRCDALSGQLETFPDRSPLISVFTSMFMHGSLLHLGGNMLFLWVFGNNVEDRMGRVLFLLFYLSAGVIAAYAQALISPNETIPLVGASGAIAGTLGAYIVMFPHARVLTAVFFFFITMIELPAIIVLGLWFGLQLLSGFGSLGQQVSGGVAFFAHIGGFVFGLITVYAFAAGRRPLRPRY